MGQLELGLSVYDAYGGRGGGGDIWPQIYSHCKDKPINHHSDSIFESLKEQTSKQHMVNLLYYQN